MRNTQQLETEVQRRLQAAFWNIHRYMIIRNPEKVEEYLRLFHRPGYEIAEWLDTNYPLPDDDSWLNHDPMKTPDLIRKLYPQGAPKEVAHDQPA